MEQKNVTVKETKDKIVVYGNDGVNVFVTDSYKRVVAKTNGGDDRIVTGNGDDSISSGLGNDTVKTGGGDDFVREYGGNLAGLIDPAKNTDVDRFWLGSGNDRVKLSDGGTNYVNAGSDNDDINIMYGTNHVKMGTGRDELKASRGTFYVDMGNDRDLDQFRFSARESVDATITNFNVKHDALNILGIKGVDAFRLHAKQAGDDVVFEYGDSYVVLKDVNLSEMTDANLVPIQVSESKNTIRVRGTDEDDTFVEEGNKIVIANLNDGDDSIVTGDGDDKIKTGKGNDTAVSGAGNDTLDAGEGDDFAYGGKGNDVVSGGDGSDKLRGNRGNDELNGDAGADDLRGGGGNDMLDGGADNDFLLGENGADTVFGGAGDDVLNGGSGGGVGDGFADTFVYASTNDGGGGFDRVKDFEDGTDVLDLTSFGFSDFADVQALASNAGSGDMRINFGDGDVLYIENFQLANFTADDVLL